MKYALRRLFFKVRNYSHRFGFGVQSPFAYRFVREVVRPSAALCRLNLPLKAYPETDAERLSLLSLYARIACWKGPCAWAVAVYQFDLCRDFILAASPKSTVIDAVYGYEKVPVASADALIMTLESNWQDIYETFAGHAHAASLLVIEDIHATKAALTIWQSVVADSRVSLTFDLFSCGIVFFDATKSHANYRIPM